MGWRDTPSSSSTPKWFWDAVETESREDSVEVANCAVHYRCWGDPGKPGVLLAHGMQAHSRWWDFIAPHLMDDYYLVASDFTGMGDSDYRYDYTAAMFSDELAAVMEASGIGRGTLVGHSFGGYIGIKTANRHPDKVARLILVDVAVRTPHDQIDYETKAAEEMPGGASIFPTAEAARQRFRLRPPQPCENKYLVEYIARRSIMRADAGWTWKFDEDLKASLAAGHSHESGAENFSNIGCPLGLIYGADSILYTENTVPYMQTLRDKPFPVTKIEDAQHHLFLDQPLEFVAALREMLKTVGA